MQDLLFDPADDVEEHDAAERRQGDAGKHQLGVDAVAGLDNDVADAPVRSGELSDDGFRNQLRGLAGFCLRPRSI